MEKFYVLYNDCYGGFGINKEAIKEYNRRAIEDGQTTIYEIDSNRFEPDRDDPILIAMYLDKEWNTDGNRLNTKHSRINIAEFNMNVHGCIDIHEYDGQEIPYVNKEKLLKKECIKILYDDSINDSTKISKLKTLIN